LVRSWQAELGQVDRRQDDQQWQQRQGDDAVGQTHQEGVQRAAVVAGQEPERGADHGGEERGGQPDQQRHPAAVEQAQQQVAAELVGAQPVRGGRRLKARQQRHPVGVEPECGLGQRRGQRD
jgi:hypothetical protein